MVLNYIWIAFFLIAFVVAVGKLVIGGDTAVFTEIQRFFRFGQDGFRDFVRINGDLVALAGHHEDR